MAPAPSVHEMDFLKVTGSFIFIFNIYFYFLSNPSRNFGRKISGFCGKSFGFLPEKSAKFQPNFHPD